MKNETKEVLRVVALYYGGLAVVIVASAIVVGRLTGVGLQDVIPATAAVLLVWLVAAAFTVYVGLALVREKHK